MGISPIAVSVKSILFASTRFFDIPDEKSFKVICKDYKYETHTRGYYNFLGCGVYVEEVDFHKIFPKKHLKYLTKIALQTLVDELTTFFFPNGA